MSADAPQHVVLDVYGNRIAEIGPEQWHVFRVQDQAAQPIAIT